ncbi:MAG: Ppx/GppA family phosphatase [Deltaproteobacteria bacterium]|nr:Ppx/GppA family phosphatase [Deltaproteobacteria bacterium]
MSASIGTNTLRLLVAEMGDIDSGHKCPLLQPLVVKRIITRLGGDFKEDVGIAETSIERAVDALKVFANIIKEQDVKDVFAFATSVVRRAKNKDKFIKRVFDETGIKINIISGDEEAGLSLLGVLSVIKNKNEKCLVIDIGGGSTEFIAVENDKMFGAWSMEMGVVHLTEEYLKSDPPAKNELNAMEREINGVIKKLKDLMNRDLPSAFSLLPCASFVGTAGTITTLAAIDQNLETYAPEKVNNYVLDYDSVKRIYNHLSSLPLKERQKILSLEKGREDLIIPGAAIVLKTMDVFGFDSITVSDAGLLEGILLKKVIGNR